MGVKTIGHLKLHLRRLVERLALLDAHVEEFLWRKPERTRKEHGGKLRNAGIVFLDRVVEETAGGSELVLDVGQLALELHEILIGLEVRIGLAKRKQLPQRSGERILGSGLRRNPARLGRHRRVAGPDHRLERAAL